MADALAVLLLMVLIIYPIGFAIMVWYPFFNAMRQGKMVTEVYGFTGVFTNMARAVIWPYYAWKKTG